MQNRIEILDDLPLQLICSYVLRPLAYLMGVQWDDCGIVGELIGIKTFLNEFLAYGELSTYLKNRELCIGRILAVSNLNYCRCWQWIR